MSTTDMSADNITTITLLSRSILDAVPYNKNIAVKLAYLLYNKHYNVDSNYDANGIMGKGQVINKRDGRFINTKYVVMVKSMDKPYGKKGKPPPINDRRIFYNYSITLNHIKSMINHASNNGIDIIIQYV